MSEKTIKKNYIIGDNVHNPAVNKTGYVKGIENDTLTVRTAYGEFNWNVKDVEFIRNDKDLENISYSYVVTEKFNSKGEVTHEWSVSEDEESAIEEYELQLADEENFAVTLFTSTVKSTDYFTCSEEDQEQKETDLFASAKGPFMVLGSIYKKDPDIEDKCFLVDDLSRAQKLYDKVFQDPNLYVVSIVCDISKSNVYKNGEPTMTSLKNHRERLPESLREDLFPQSEKDGSGLSM